jgi:hypothetical protein
MQVRRRSYSRVGRLAARPAGLTLALVLATAVTASGDVINGGDGSERLEGTQRADVITGGPGDDRVRGHGGDDVLDGGLGSDDLSGGAGSDAAIYHGVAPVRITLDDLANDGRAGERDNVQTDIEAVYGSSGADDLLGSAGSDQLDAGDGDDRVDGNGGTDQLFGGNGSDVLRARDGRRDEVDCGSGADTAVLDTSDVARGCEIIDRRPLASAVDASLRWTAWLGTSTRYTTLRVTDVYPSTASLSVVCRGPGCPISRRQLGARRDAVRVLANARLRPGSRLELRLTARSRVGKLIRLVTRRDAEPARTDLCTTRGRPVRCPV